MNRSHAPGELDIPNSTVIREAEFEDAAALKILGDRVLAETDFFLHEPAERAGGIDDMKSIIAAFREAPNSVMLNAWHGGAPVGEGVLIGGQLNRTLHAASLGIGVLSRYHGTGIAEKLMLGMEEWAVAKGIRRIELTVMTNNTRARRFYDRLGYREEGVKRGSAFIKGVWTDEFLMSKLFGDLAKNRQ